VVSILSIDSCELTNYFISQANLGTLKISWLGVIVLLPCQLSCKAVPQPNKEVSPMINVKLNAFLHMISIVLIDLIL
jgi:hypothetical protein